MNQRIVLSDSPFSKYFIPGLILAVVVGGTQTMASSSLLRPRLFGPGRSA